MFTSSWSAPQRTEGLTLEEYLIPSFSKFMYLFTKKLQVQTLYFLKTTLTDSLSFPTQNPQFSSTKFIPLPSQVFWDFLSPWYPPPITKFSSISYCPQNPHWHCCHFLSCLLHQPLYCSSSTLIHLPHYQAVHLVISALCLKSLRGCTLLPSRQN